MSAFAVFGYSMPVAMRHAHRKLEKELRHENTSLDPEAFGQRQREIAAEHFKAWDGKGGQISPLFDAPQFAKDWMVVAGDQIKAVGIKKLTVTRLPDGKTRRNWSSA